jgi:lysophospholipase L1-like esterase
VSSVSFFGIRGAMIKDLNTLLHQLYGNHHDIILLDLGTNDIASGVPVFQIANAISEWLSELRAFHKGVICILSVVPRLGGLRGMSPESFMSESNRLETTLRNMAQSYQHVLYHKHKGFYDIEIGGKKLPLSPNQWSRDGIHPNNLNGRKKYGNSIRLAVAKAVKCFKASGTPVAY